MYLALQSELFGIYRNTCAFCAEMRMVVGAEKDIAHNVLVPYNSKKTAHTKDSLFICRKKQF